MLLISEDDTVMMIKMITMKTIMKMKMMGMKPFAIALLDFFCFFLSAWMLKANMAVGAIWYLMLY